MRRANVYNVSHLGFWCGNPVLERNLSYTWPHQTESQYLTFKLSCSCTWMVRLTEGTSNPASSFHDGVNKDFALGSAWNSWWGSFSYYHTKRKVNFSKTDSFIASFEVKCQFATAVLNQFDYKRYSVKFSQFMKYFG